MEQPTNARCCPSCQSTDYLLRARKKIAANPEAGEPAYAEVKRRCKACGEEWKEHEPVIERPQPK